MGCCGWLGRCGSRSTTSGRQDEGREGNFCALAGQEAVRSAILKRNSRAASKIGATEMSSTGKAKCIWIDPPSMEVNISGEEGVKEAKEEHASSPPIGLAT